MILTIHNNYLYAQGERHIDNYCSLKQEILKRSIQPATTPSTGELQVFFPLLKDTGLSTTAHKPH